VNGQRISEMPSISPEILWLGQGDEMDARGRSVTETSEVGKKVTRAVIVEDEMFVALHLETVLQDLGLEVCEIVATGGDAVETAMTLEPDIIFMDINLRGDIDGVEAARLIRTTSDIPIVFVTAYGDEAMRTRVHAVAPHAPVIQKPPMTSALVAAIRKAIGT
jgi:two-component system, response regulator PdtaR